MSWLPESKDHLPLTWWKGQPIYLSAMVAIGAVASMIFTAVLMAAAPATLEYLIFTFGDWGKLHLWAPVTYALVNPPSFWLVISGVMFWRFGEAVERHLGRTSFIKLLVVLLLVSPLLVTLAGLFGPSRGCAGVTEIFFGTFIAFAALYPHVMLSLIFFSLEAWMLAAAIVGVNALMALAGRDWIGLLILAGHVGTAVAYIRYEQGILTLPKIPTFQATPPASRNAPNPTRSSGGGNVNPAPVPKVKKHSPAVDDILDKISREGMHSLTPDERRILDQASEDLQKRKG